MKIGNKDYRLPKRFKQGWIKALRSGKYQQGESFLKKTDENNVERYCCLGVACEITKNPIREYDDSWITKYNNKNGKIPKLLVGKGDHSVDDNGDILPEGVITQKLSGMNDGGRSFKYIAKWIERYL